MKIKLNGQARDLDNIGHLAGLVEAFCRHKTPVIAEVNGEIIKASHWEATALKEGDTVELVSFVGGGSIENCCSYFANEQLSTNNEQRLS